MMATTRNCLEDKFLNNITKLINFECLFEIFKYKRFRELFPMISHEPIYTSSSNDIKKQFVKYCLETNEKEFIGLLLHTSQDNAAEYIEPSIAELIDPTILDPNKGNLATNCPYVELIPSCDKLMKSTDQSISNQYNMTTSPRGICLIINNYFTYGTFKETQRFRNIFYQLHFDVIIERNLTAQQIRQKLLNLSRDKALENHEAFACLIISHGTDKAEIIGFDSGRIEIRELCQFFDDVNCPQLKGKPRMFVFNCCRGNQDFYYDYFAKENANLAPNETTAQQPLAIPVQPDLPKLPKILDFLICYSTLDGYAAYVDWNEGTKFGTHLCESLIHKGWVRDMNSILIRTNNTLQHIQPFNWELSLTHLISFNPTEPFERKFM